MGEFKPMPEITRRNLDEIDKVLSIIDTEGQNLNIRTIEIFIKKAEGIINSFDKGENKDRARRELEFLKNSLEASKENMANKQKTLGTYIKRTNDQIRSVIVNFDEILG